MAADPDKQVISALTMMGGEAYTFGWVFPDGEMKAKYRALERIKITLRRTKTKWYGSTDPWIAILHRTVDITSVQGIGYGKTPQQAGIRALERGFYGSIDTGRFDY